VYINGVKVATQMRLDTICVFVASFLTFNLRHPKTQESVLETLEFLFGLRHHIENKSASLFCRSLPM
jgi:hypothetical protein